MSRITEEHVNDNNALVFVEGGEFDKAVCCLSLIVFVTDINIVFL